MTRRTVLVADDDPMIRQVLATVLDLEEFEVVLACDGDEALAKLHDALPDAVVLDQMMPGKSGFEVLAAMCADDATASVPVVLLTAAQVSSLPADPVEAGAAAHLEKPFSPLHLLEVLESLLRSPR
jgi:two-component system phosphate regulon response regulator PhoB